MARSFAHLTTFGKWASPQVFTRREPSTSDYRYFRTSCSRWITLVHERSSISDMAASWVFSELLKANSIRISANGKGYWWGYVAGTSVVSDRVRGNFSQILWISLPRPSVLSGTTLTIYNSDRPYSLLDQ